MKEKGRNIEKREKGKMEPRGRKACLIMLDIRRRNLILTVKYSCSQHTS